MKTITLVLAVPDSDLPARIIIASALREVAGPILEGCLDGDKPATKAQTSCGVEIAIAVSAELAEEIVEQAVLPMSQQAPKPAASTIAPPGPWPFPDRSRR